MLPRLVVLISGSGTNLQAIIDAIDNGELSAEIVLVVSNRKSAYGLIRAEQRKLPTLYHPLKPYTDNGRTREDYERDLAVYVAPYRPDLIVLAGWMHVFGAAFLDQFPGSIINLHPALPGAFPGTQAIQRAFEAYRRGEVVESGCMVHLVVPEVDAGRVIAQSTVPIFASDTLESFEARMHEAEHKLIVQAVRQYLEERA